MTWFKGKGYLVLAYFRCLPKISKVLVRSTANAAMAV
jgi:hypothetical protein